MELLLLPISWSVVNKSKKLKGNSYIRILGYTTSGELITVYVPKRATLIIRFPYKVTDELVVMVEKELEPVSIRTSSVDSNVLITRIPYSKISNDFSLWGDVQQDPFGEVQSLWEFRKLTPYDWISIKNFNSVSSSPEREILVEEDFISSVPLDKEVPSVNSCLFFWEVKLFSLSALENIIIVFVIIIEERAIKGFIIINYDLPSNIINMKLKNIKLITAKDEKDLLDKFLTLYKLSKPIRQICYNNHLFKNLFDVETIDLSCYFKRFYPYTDQCKQESLLSAVTTTHRNVFIDNFLLSIKSGDKKKIIKTIKMIDNSLMFDELYDLGRIQESVEFVCNLLRVSIDVLLYSPIENIIDSLVYNIDPGSIFIKGQKGITEHVRSVEKGIYHNVYIYEYSEIYRRLMLSSNQELVHKLGNSLEFCPPKIVTSAFYSGYVNRELLILNLYKILNELISKNKIITLEPFIIRSKEPINAEWLKLQDIALCFVLISNTSYICLSKSGRFECVGFDVKFPFIEDIIKKYIVSCYINKLDEFEVPDLTTLSLENFVLTEKLYKSVKLDPQSIKYKLLQQYQRDIDDCVTVKYFMTKDSPLLIKDIKAPGLKITLDYEYYNKEITRVINILKSLKVYK
ncbi:MAG: hypothetical protein QXV60_04155 [Nitrososphaerota archaeon]